jgi:hypothetical protein
MAGSGDGFIENYGYVPFLYFQWFILCLQVYMIVNYKYVNDMMDTFFDREDRTKQNIKKIILSIPLLLIVYYDIMYSSFSLKNLGFDPKYNDKLKQILNIFGSYAIIHIFAQDTDLKTAILQNELVQVHLLFVLFSIGMAYSITQNRSQSIIALILFYHLKYVISENRLIKS